MTYDPQSLASKCVEQKVFKIRTVWEIYNHISKMIMSQNFID